MGLRDRMKEQPKREIQSTISRTALHPIKDEKPVVVSLFLNAIDHERLGAIQRELSWFRKPAPVVWVLDWIFLRCQEDAELEGELVRLVETYSEDLQAEPMKTSVKIDAEVADWMAKVTGKSRLYKAPTVVIRWIIDEWDRIKLLTGFELYHSRLRAGKEAPTKPTKSKQNKK